MEKPTKEQIALFKNQKELLDKFLKNHNISIEQYETSLTGLTHEMHMEEVLEDILNGK